MLLPSKIILLAQVYICLVNKASGVSVNYADGSETNEIDGGLSATSNGAWPAPPGHPVRAAIASRVLPEIRAAQARFSPFHKNQILLEPSGFEHLHKSQPGGHYESGPIGASGLQSNSLDSSAALDFDSYSITISPTLMLNANDKDQEELEEKIETHTNNHHQQPEGVPNKKINHNSRHYGAHQTVAKHQNYLSSTSSAAGKYVAPLSGFSNNNNLNYIHSLLLAKPPSQAPSSLAGLLYGSMASSATSGSPSHQPPVHHPASSLLGAHQQKHVQLETQHQNMTLLDLSAGPSSGATVCGRQQVAGAGSREPRIVGGNHSYEGEFPWAVSIQRHGNHHCGGVIVGRRWILTAAHCVRSQLVGNLIVRTGGNTLARSANHLSSHLERDYLVDQIVMHGDFSRYDNLTASQMKSSANTNNADIALLRLRHEIHWNELVWPVCFPPREAGNFSGHDAVVIGWGKLNEKSEEFSNELQKVKLTIIDNKVCQNWFRQAGREMPIDDRVICAGFKSGGKDACHGDSGGPLLSKINGHYAVVGVVSTGIGCARPLLPGLYSRVSSYINWIERHIT